MRYPTEITFDTPVTFSYLTNKVKLDKNNLVINIEKENGAIYDIDLKTLTDSAHFLDMILQLRTKGWVTPEILYDFLMSVDQACHFVFNDSLQSVFCPTGINKHVK
jgi:hypothetical protein